MEPPLKLIVAGPVTVRVAKDVEPPVVVSVNGPLIVAKPTAKVPPVLLIAEVPVIENELVSARTLPPETRKLVDAPPAVEEDVNEPKVIELFPLTKNVAV